MIRLLPMLDVQWVMAVCKIVEIREVEMERIARPSTRGAFGRRKVKPKVKWKQFGMLSKAEI
jgi:hypothetical protein